MVWIVIPTFIFCALLEVTADIPLNDNTNSKK